MELSQTTTLLCGRFELMREEPSNCGVQLFGPTLAVLDIHNGEPARACILDAALLPTAEERAAVVRQLGELADLQEPSLVPQVFVGEDGDRVVVCYDPLQGAFALRDMNDGPGNADLVQEVQRLARQLARALATLHGRGWVHGMLAGEAVFVGPRGPAAFQHGFAPLCARAELERRWAAQDPAVIAPEVRAGGAFTPAGDCYAWGVAIAEFATGLRGGAAVHAAEPAGLPAGLWALVGACLAPDPAARPRDGADLTRRLEALALGADPNAEAPPLTLETLGASVAVDPEPSVLEVLAERPAPPPAPPTRSAPRPPPPPAVAPRPAAFAAFEPPPVLAPRPPVVAAFEPPPVEPPAVTGLEELLSSGDRTRPPAPSPEDVVAAATSSGSYPVADSGSRSGSESGGRSASGLRRVHVLTEDSIVRRNKPETPGEPSGAIFDSNPSASRSLEVAETPASPLVSTSVPTAPPQPPAGDSLSRSTVVPAPKRPDITYWVLIAVLLVAVALAFAFT